MTMREESEASEGSAMGMQARAGQLEEARAIGRFDVVCRDANGVERWSDSFQNLVTSAGKSKLLDATLKTGLTAPVWYIGLITGPGAGNTYAVADTMPSHAGWAENTSYSEGTRRTLTLGAITGVGPSVDNVASPAVFTLSGAATIAGCFVADVATKGGATGTLYSAGNSSSGDKAGGASDTITVTYTASIT